MGNALQALQRLQRQAADRAAQAAVVAQDGPDRPKGHPTGPPAAPGGSQALTTPRPPAGLPSSSSAAGPVALCGPVALDDLAELERAALAAAALLVQLPDGREVFLGVAAGVDLAWPLGVVDERGRPLPYLRAGSVVVPVNADERWRWWQGGLPPAEVQAQLVTAGQGGEE